MSYSIYDNIYINSTTNKIGIGTTLSVDDKLTIWSTDIAGLRVQTDTDYAWSIYANSNNTGGFEIGVNAANDQDAPGYGYLWSYDDTHGIHFGTSNTERMRIEPNGDITFGNYFSIPNPENTSFILQTRLQAADAAGGEAFGNAVAISADGNTLAVGAILDTHLGGIFAGSVFIFTRVGSTWSQQARLQADDAAFNDWFGFSVAISADGNTLAIGSVQDDNSGGTDAGSAYIFTRNGSTWSQQARLQASNAQPSGGFGWSITISADGNMVAVGAIFTTHFIGVPAAGAVYIYTRSGSVWSPQAYMQSGDPGVNDQFGYSVALSPDSKTLAVGAWLHNNSGGVDAGSVYIFSKTTSNWTFVTRLQASDAYTRNQFGFSVGFSFDGTVLAVGANRHFNPGDIDSGSVYIFRKSGSFWTEEIRLRPSDAAAEDYFGRSLSISYDGNTLAVGAVFDNNPGGIDAGAVYVFKYENSTWSQVTKLVATDPNSEDWLGLSVALSSDGLTLAGGATRHDNSGGVDAGSVFVFIDKFIGVIGIGTTDPLSKIHIYYDDTRNADLLRIDSYGLTTPFVVNSRGNVGIGTTNPNVSLHIESTSSILLPKGTTSQRPQGVTGLIRYNTELATFEGYGAGNAWGSLGGVKSTDQLTYITADNTSNLSFYTGGIQRLVVNSNGNLGIGTTNPIVSLHVNRTDAILLPKGSTSQRPGGVTGLMRYNTELSTFEGYGAGNAWGSLGGVKSTDQLTYITADNTSNLSFFTGGVQRMVINSNGNMLLSGNIIPSACNVYSIGSSNFRFKDIYLSGNTIDLGGTLISRDSLTGTIAIRSGSGNLNDKLDITAKNAFIDNTIGIGTAFPTNALHVEGNIYATGSLIGSNLILLGDTLTIDTVTSNANQVIIENMGNGPALKVTQGGNNSLAEFYDKESGIALYIENTGLVGIRNNQPTEALHVTGSVLSTTGYKVNTLVAIGSSLEHYVDSTRGIRNVTGDYGTIQVFGDGLNGWEGYSINGRYVFTSSDNNTCGLYNDIDNQWMLYFNRTTSANGTITLYHAGSEKLITSSTGITINGNIELGTLTNKATLTYATNTARTYTIPDAGANATFVMTEGTQTINGAKTFGSVPTFPNQTAGTVFAAPTSSTGAPSFRAIAASDLPTVNIGTTAVPLSRASGSLALTGITSIDGTATNVTGTVAVANGGIGTTTTTSKFFFAGPNATNGAPSFRAIVASDIPTLNQNTTGTAANVTGIVAVANGGTGLSTVGSGNQFFASPNGTSGAPSFRSILSSDLPSVYIGNSLVPLSRAQAAIALTGITSIDGTATGLTGSPSITVNNVTLPQNPVGTTYGNTVNATPSFMISQTFGDNDGWRIYGESSSTNTGRLIIETVDDYDTNESIVFRQKKTYTDFLARDLMTISGGNGNVTVLGSVTAASFSGTFSGTATQVSQILTRGDYLTGANYNGSTATRWDVDATTAATASKVVARDSERDIFCRLVRSDYTDQSTISGGMAYRVNTTDNYIRFCNDTAAIRTFLDVPTRTGVNASGNWTINAATVTNGVYTTGDQDIGGTKKLTGRVNIQPSSSGGGQNIFNGVEAITTANGRAQLILSSAYSDIVIASSQTNANGHGSTLTFATYNPSNAGDYRKMVIGQGNWGAGEDKLYFGYGSTIPNPHSAYSASSSILTVDGTNRRVGIDTPTPSEKLHVVGNSLLNGTVSTNNNAINAGTGTLTTGDINASGIITLNGNGKYIRHNTTSSWGGDPGSGWGKLEYHSNRWYLVSGSDSAECLRIRRSGTDVFVIDNSGVVTTGNVPWGRLSSVPSASTSAAGIVQLTDSVSTTSSTLAATATAVKSANDNANTRALANQTMFIGTTSVAINRASATLNLTGIGDITTSGTFYFPNNGAGLNWGSSFSRIYDDGHLRIVTDDSMFINAPTDLTVTTPATSFTGRVAVTGLGGSLYEVTTNVANGQAAATGSWTTDAGSTAWGATYRLNGTGYAWADAPATRDFSVPSGMRHMFINQLEWSNCGYFDVYGLIDSVWLFITRINSFQNVQNTSVSTGGEHSGINIAEVGGVNRFSQIRISVIVGRLHLMGIGWSRQTSGVTTGGQSGFIHWDNVYSKPTITSANTGNAIVQRDGNGDFNARYIYTDYLNMSHGTGTRSSDTIFYSSTDNFLRKTDATGMRASLNVPTRTGGDASGSWTINASTATLLQNARNINGTSFNGGGDITTANWGSSRTITIGSTGKAVNGGGDVSWSLAEINAATMISSINPNSRINSGFYENSGATTANGWPVTTNSWYHLIASTHSNTANYYSMQLAADFFSNTLYYRSTNGSGTTGWSQVVLNSGSWSINAATATTLQTGRNINGTSFNGGGNITTATWGTARTITIGSTGKSVDGSGNVSWSLGEIGAASSSHNHDSTYASISHNHDSTYLSRAINTWITSSDGNSRFYFANGSTTYIRSQADIQLRTGGDTTRFTLNTSGDLSVTGDVIAYSSDKRLKTNFRPIEKALDKVCTLNGLIFDWIPEINTLGFHPNHMLNDTGLLAQEVQAVVEQAVAPAPFDQEYSSETNTYNSKSGEHYLTVQYHKLIPLIIESIKELAEDVKPSTQQTDIINYIGKVVYISHIESSEDIPIIAYTNKPADKRFYGIVVEKMEKENTTLCKLHTQEPMIVKTKGFVWIWVTNINGSILEQGDYITSSYLEGYAMAQGTVTSTNSTIGKVLKDIDFKDPFLEDHYKVRYLTETGLEILSDEFKFDRCHIAVLVLCCV